MDIAFLDINMPKINGIELAKKVREIRPHIKIIFVTAYSEYLLDAFKMHADGYLMKPATLEDIQAELDHIIRQKETETEKHLRVQCFGEFEVFYDKKPVKFARSKTKELFAYLVHRKGASVTVGEICAVLWENAPDSKAMQSYFRQCVGDLKKTLEDLGEADVLIKSRNAYAVNISAFWCDSYEYDHGNKEVMNFWNGEYMYQYSWGEMQVGRFRDI